MADLVGTVTDSSFEATVLKAPKPVLVDFTAPWCNPCKDMEPAVAAVAVHFDGVMSVVAINVDDNQSVTQRFGIKGIPTLILFRAGKEEERIVGKTSEESVVRMLEKHVKSRP
jgi:thioredoxin 1